MTLKIQNQDHYDAVLTFAEKAGLRQQLEEKLQYLATYAEHGERGKTQCTLRRDFAPYSFEFVIERRDADGQYQPWFVGGLIYHGTHDNGGDGSYPSLAVTLQPVNGWSVHT